MGVLLFVTVSFVNADKKITVVTTNKWEPFNMIYNNRLEGIGIDFWKLVAKKAGIEYRFKIVEKWINVLETIKNSTAALTISTDKTDDRQTYAVFSKPYVKYPLVIATRNSVGFIFDVEYLKNKKIAVGKNYTAAHLMLKKYLFKRRRIFCKDKRGYICNNIKQNRTKRVYKGKRNI